MSKGLNVRGTYISPSQVFERCIKTKHYPILVKKNFSEFYFYCRVCNRIYRFTSRSVKFFTMAEWTAVGGKIDFLRVYCKDCGKLIKMPRLVVDELCSDCLSVAEDSY